MTTWKYMYRWEKNSLCRQVSFCIYTRMYVTHILKLSMPTANASGSIVSIGLSESSLKENIKWS